MFLERDIIAFDAGTGTGMSRKNKGIFELIKGVHNRMERTRIISIGRAMNRRQHIATGFYLQTWQKLRSTFSKLCLHTEQHIIHYIPNHTYPNRNTFLLQAAACRFGGAKMAIREMISHYPVDLLGHSAIKTAQARLYM